MAFKYQRRSQENWQKRREQQGGDFEGIFSDQFQIFKDKKGKNTIRILPPTWDHPEHYGLDVHVHYNVGPKGTVLCPKEHFGKKCPMCEAFMEASRDATTEDEKRAANQLKANRRVAVWVLNRDDEDKGPMIWAMPWRLDKEIAEQAEDPQSHELYELDDPVEGFDLFFDREGEGQTTKRSGLKLARRASSVNKKWLNFVADHPLPDTLQWRSYNQIKALYAGEDETDDAPRPSRSRRPEPDEDEEERSPRRSNRRTPTEEDDDNERAPARSARRAEPDEEEERAPRRTRASNGAAADEDDIPWDRLEKPRRRAAADDEDERATPVVRQRMRAKPEPEEEEERAPRRRAARDEENDSENRPANNRRRAAEPDEDEEERAPRRPSRRSDPDEDDDDGTTRATPSSALRDAMARRRPA